MGVTIKKYCGGTCVQVREDCVTTFLQSSTSTFFLPLLPPLPHYPFMPQAIPQSSVSFPVAQQSLFSPKLPMNFLFLVKSGEPVSLIISFGILESFDTIFSVGVDNTTVFLTVLFLAISSQSPLWKKCVAWCLV